MKPTRRQTADGDPADGDLADAIAEAEALKSEVATLRSDLARSEADGRARTSSLEQRLAAIAAENARLTQYAADVESSTLGRLAARWTRFKRHHPRRARWIGRPISMARWLRGMHTGTAHSGAERTLFIPEPPIDAAALVAAREAVSRVCHRRGIKTSRTDVETAAALVCRCFDAGFYLERNPDVAAMAVHPLVHYITTGAGEGRAPNPVCHIAGYTYDHPDVADFEDNPLLHYVLEGRRRGATLHPLFDASWYSDRYADVRAARRDPYEHFLTLGRHEGRATSPAVTEGTDITAVEIRLPHADPEEVTIIIPAYEHYALTYRCLYALAKRTPASLNVRVILADDSPGRPLRSLLDQVDGLVITENHENLGFVGNCNQASRLAKGDFIVFLNNDTVVADNWLEELVSLARGDRAIGMVGCMLLNADGSLQEAGNVMFKDGWGYPYGRGDDPDKPEYGFVRHVDCVSGACFLVRRDVFEGVGRIDEAFAPAFFEEYDLAFAVAKAGYKVLYQPASRIWHYGSASYGPEVRDRQSSINHARFVDKWRDTLETRRQGPAELFLARERPHANGTILVIEDKVPEYDKHAGGLSVFQYLRLLASLDFKVILLPDDRRRSEPYTTTLEQLGVEVLYGGARVDRWLTANGRYLDWVLVARPEVARRHIGLVRRKTRARLLYYTHDLHFQREMRRYETTDDPQALHESDRLKRLETKIFRSVDCVLTPSADEVAIIRSLAPGQEVRTLTPYFYPAASPASTDIGVPISERRCLIFVGGYAHLPNVDAAVLLAKGIMPLVWAHVPDARLLLVGSDPPANVWALAGERVEVVGYVPDLTPSYARARMSVSPLRFGAGLKGKIVSSLAAGVPVITTTIGNEGIGLLDGTEALIADDEAGIAAQIVRLFEDTELLESLVAAGHHVIAERFNVERVRASLFAALGVTVS